MATFLHTMVRITDAEKGRALSGEHEYSVPPLAVPELGTSAPPATLAAYEAVQLFLERAQAVKPGFDLTSENAPPPTVGRA
jgi:predicted ATPase